MRKMKYSGIEWIGDIPEHWEVIKLKYLGICKNGLTYSPDNVVDEDKGILVLRSSNIQDGKLVFEDNVYVNLQNDLFKIQKGDILICSRNGSRSLIGKNAIIDKEIKAYYGAFMMIYRCKSPKYMYYILNSNIFKYYLGSFFTSTINQLTGENFKNIIIPYTFNDVEQQKIAAYLDKKCASIDSIIDKEQKLIEKLKEYKQSLITETVTKGLNPDAPMKDSGIEWIGDIPEHWKLCRLKNYAIIQNGQDQKNVFDKNGKYSVIGSGGVFSHANDFLYDKPSVLLGRKGTIDKPLYIEGKFWVVDTMYYTIIKDNVYPKFFYYLCSIIPYNYYQYGSAVPSMTQRDLNSVQFPYVLYEEQKQIADYLDKKCSKIDENISKRQALIEKLNEYKKSLIYEVVTGKMEV